MSLAELLAQRIAQSGPMPVAEFMALCLSHPVHGYYVKRDPLGAAGDFTTAPEISQMFGELVGLALAQSWVDQGRPNPFCLAELGPGRGSLMADLWRATASVPGFQDAARLHLVELSPVLRAAQARALAKAQPVWHHALDDLPDLPLFLIANEFFDALPIRQHLRTEAGWRERLLGLDGTALAWGLSPPQPLEIDAPEGSVLEHSPLGEAMAQALGERLSRRGGTVLAIDYGAWEGTGDTLQALSRHAPADPLAAPGTADLTAHVQFGALAAAAVEAGAEVAGFAEMGAWLTALGLEARAAALTQAAPARAEEIAGQTARLTEGGPTGMGSLFKILALTAPKAPPIAGFPPIRTGAR
ncbi:MAG: SAM-dependent methyltransferase [Pseudomonadota bacterium]